jgi:hypothetical protein
MLGVDLEAQLGREEDSILMSLTCLRFHNPATSSTHDSCKYSVATYALECA